MFLKTNIVINNQIIKTMFLNTKIIWKENKIYQIYDDNMSILLTINIDGCIIEYYEDINEMSQRKYLLNC